MIENSHENLGLADGVVVFADDWGRHPSSCQHIIRRLRERHKVLWVNTIGTRSATVDSFTLFRGSEKIKNWCRGLQKVHENMWVVDAPMLPGVSSPFSKAFSSRLVTSYLKLSLYRLGIKKPAILTTLPHVGWLVGNISQTQTIYYCTDDYSQWRGADHESLLQSEQELIGKSSRVLAVSRSLLDRLGRSTEDIEYYPHAVDFEHFSTAMNQEGHGHLDEYPRPRVGFFGLIYEKLDFDLLAKLAERIAPSHLIMIGPTDYCSQNFREQENVVFTGKVPYEVLPEWISGLDVLILPYQADDEMIRQSSPLKLRECLATGIPTVSVHVAEVAKYIPHVDVAKSQDEFISLVKKSLNDSKRSKARQSSVQNETWEHRSVTLEKFLNLLAD